MCTYISRKAAATSWQFHKKKGKSCQISIEDKKKKKFCRQLRNHKHMLPWITEAETFAEHTHTYLTYI